MRRIRAIGVRHLSAAVLAGFSSLVASGCLQSDLTETWYVDASGGVTWVVQERDVRSDAQSAPDRRDEESIYWLAVQQERHPMAEALRELGAEKVRTVVLRSESPFDVRTEAKLPGLDILGQRLIAAIGSTGTSIVTRQGDRWEWTMTVRDPSAVNGSYEPGSAMTGLLDGLERLKVVLTAGRFEKAEGFEITGSGREARFNYKEPDGKKSDEPAVTLRLSWKVD